LIVLVNPNFVHYVALLHIEVHVSMSRLVVNMAKSLLRYTITQPPTASLM